jgi:hypothetical protein
MDLVSARAGKTFQSIERRNGRYKNVRRFQLDAVRASGRVSAEKKLDPQAKKRYFGRAIPIKL